MGIVALYLGCTFLYLIDLEGTLKAFWNFLFQGFKLHGRSNPFPRIFKFLEYNFPLSEVMKLVYFSNLVLSFFIKLTHC